MARASSFPVTPGDNVTTSPLRPCTLSNGVAATFNEGVSTSALAGGELPLGSGLFPRSCGGGRGRESCKGDTGREDGDSERRGDSAAAGNNIDRRNKSQGPQSRRWLGRWSTLRLCKSYDSHVA